MARSGDTEAFGLVFAEAMASGLPVVGTSVGGIPEVVIGGRTGLVVEPKSAAALAIPYARMLRADRRYHGIERTAALAAADAVGLGALLAGSATARTVVL